MSVLDPEDRERCTCGELSSDPQYHKAPCPIAGDQTSADIDVLAELEKDFADVDYGEIVRQAEDEAENVRDLSKAQLLQRFASIERSLREIKELHVPRTQQGRDLHSRRTAYLVELRRRKMR